MNNLVYNEKYTSHSTLFLFFFLITNQSYTSCTYNSNRLIIMNRLPKQALMNRLPKQALMNRLPKQALMNRLPKQR